MTGQRVSKAAWLALIGAPLLFLGNLEITFALVRPACNGSWEWVLHLVNFIDLIAIAGAAVLAARAWRGAEPEAPRFVAAMGAWLAAFCAVATLAQWLPQFFLDPCLR